MVEIGRDVTLRSDDFLAEDHHTVLVEQKIFRMARADDIFEQFLKIMTPGSSCFHLTKILGPLGSPWVYPLGY